MKHPRAGELLYKRLSNEMVGVNRVESLLPYLFPGDYVILVMPNGKGKGKDKGQWILEDGYYMYSTFDTGVAETPDATPGIYISSIELIPDNYKKYIRFIPLSLIYRIFIKQDTEDRVLDTIHQYPLLSNANGDANVPDHAPHPPVPLPELPPPSTPAPPAKPTRGRSGSGSNPTPAFGSKPDPFRTSLFPVHTPPEHPPPSPQRPAYALLATATTPNPANQPLSIKHPLVRSSTIY
jgi:hypothetical protein